MDDSIYRQAAIDVLDVLCQEHRYRIPGERETYSQYNEAWQDALDRAEGAIGNLPSAQRWIPCAERLPEKGVEVLTYSDYELINFIEIQSIEPHFGMDCWENQNGDLQELWAVTAWMPLPEPYRGEQHE